jgi:hypothetical protein
MLSGTADFLHAQEQPAPGHMHTLNAADSVPALLNLT